MSAERPGHGWKSIKLKTKEEITKRVCGIFNDLYGDYELEKFPDMNFVEAIVLDSIDFLELMRRLEMAFDMDIDLKLFADARTLNQLVNQLHDTLSKKTA